MKTLKERLMSERYVLTAVQQHYNPIEHSGLCSVITLVMNTTGLHEECGYLKNYIRGVLGTCIWLDEWVRRNVSLDETLSLSREEFNKKMYLTRCAWISWMIKCYDERLAVL